MSVTRRFLCLFLLLVPYAAGEEVVALRIQLGDYFAKSDLGGKKLPELPKDRAAVVKDLEALDAGFKREEFLPKVLAYLIQFDPDKDFSRWLWRAGVYAEWQERVASPLWKRPVLPELLKLCGELPVTDPYYYEGQFLAATSERECGAFEAEAERLKKELDRPEIPEKFVAPYRLAYVSALASAGRTDAAVKAVPLIRDQMRGDVAAAETWLRVSYLLLGAGRLDDALAMWKELPDVPVAQMLESSSGPLLGEAIQLAHADGANLKKYWEESAAWLPAWKKIRAEVGLPKEIPMADLWAAKPEKIQADLNDAARYGSRDRYWKMIDSVVATARWHPVATVEAIIFMTPSVFQVAPEKEEAMRSLMIQILKTAQPLSEESERRREFYLTLHLFEADQINEAWKIAGEFGGRGQPDDAISQNMLRLWGLIAARKGEPLDDPIRAMSDTLKGSDAVADRGTMVATLADLLRQSGRLEEEEALLKRELRHPVIKDGPLFMELSGQYSKLAEIVAAARSFQKGLETWTKAPDMAWLAKVEPEVVADEWKTNLAENVKTPDPSLGVAQQVKFRVLVAEDPTLPLSVRMEAFSRAFETWFKVADSAKALKARVEAVAKNTDFTPPVRGLALLQGALIALNQRLPEAAAWLDDPAVKELPPTQQALASQLRRLADIAPKDAAGLVDLFDRVSDVELDRGGAALVQEIFTRLLALGEMEKAEKILDQARAIRFTADEGMASPEEFLFGMDQAMRLAKASLPAHKAMMEKISLEEVTGGEVDFLPMAADRLDETALRRALVRDVNVGRAGESPADFWRRWLDMINRDNQHADEVLAMAALWFEKAGDDATRARLVLPLMETVDVDEPKVEAQLTKLLAPWADPVKNPETAEAITMAEVSLAVRHRSQPQAAARLEGLSDPGAMLMRVKFSLAEARQALDRGRVARILESLPTDVLFSPALLAEALAGWPPQDTRLALLRTAAEKEWRRDLDDAWMAASVSAALGAMELARELGLEGKMEQAWFEGVARVTENERCRAMLDVEWHYTKGDALGTLAAADAAIAKHPTFYSFYFARAWAEEKAGRLDDAIRDAEIFVKYCGEELEFFVAMERLAEWRERKKTEKK